MYNSLMVSKLQILVIIKKLTYFGHLMSNEKYELLKLITQSKKNWKMISELKKKLLDTKFKTGIINYLFLFSAPHHPSTKLPC